MRVVLMGITCEVIPSDLYLGWPDHWRGAELAGGDNRGVAIVVS